MAYCCVPLCKASRKNKTDGLAFHEFPTNMNMRTKWLKSIPDRNGENNSDPWKPTDRSVICSKHFLPDDYLQNLKKKRLKPHAIPSVFPDHPTHRELHAIQPALTAENVIPLTWSIMNVFHPSQACKDAVTNDVVSSQAVKKFEAAARDGSAASSLEANEPLVGLEEDSVWKRDKGVITNLTINDLATRARKCKNAQQNLKYMRGRMASMNSTSLQQVNRSLRHKLARYKIDELEKACSSRDKKALFLLEQLASFSRKKRKRWSDDTMQCCFSWHSRYPTSYRFFRKLNILTLPSRSALRRHAGSLLAASERSTTQ